MIEEFLEGVKIHLDATQRRTTFYTVIQNPFVMYHDTKVVFGGSEQIVKNKAARQYRKWEKLKDKPKLIEKKQECLTDELLF